jgi:LmbE family N-acetylglucosaminyl deacetylase
MLYFGYGSNLNLKDLGEFERRKELRKACEVYGVPSQIISKPY